MSTHTTGPWQAADVGDYGDFDGNSQVILGDDRRVAVVQVDPNSAEDRANARLIAAAPDLLEVCQRFMEFVKNGERFSYPSGSLQQLEAAIAKATGAPQ